MISRDNMVATDAGDEQIGLVLKNQPNGTERLIEYRSHLLNNAEYAYATTHRESLAVLGAEFLFGPYLKRDQFTVSTDRDSMKWIFNFDKLDGKASALVTTLSMIRVRCRLLPWN